MSAHNPSRPRQSSGPATDPARTPEVADRTQEKGGIAFTVVSGVVVLSARGRSARTRRSPPAAVSPLPRSSWSLRSLRTAGPAPAARRPAQGRGRRAGVVPHRHAAGPGSWGVWCGGAAGGGWDQAPSLVKSAATAPMPPLSASGPALARGPVHSLLRGGRLPAAPRPEPAQSNDSSMFLLSAYATAHWSMYSSTVSYGRPKLRGSISHVWPRRSRRKNQ